MELRHLLLYFVYILLTLINMNLENNETCKNS